MESVEEETLPPVALVIPYRGTTAYCALARTYRRLSVKFTGTSAVPVEARVSGAVPDADVATTSGFSRDPMSIRVRLVRFTNGAAVNVLDAFKEYTAAPVPDASSNVGTSAGALGPDSDIAAVTQSCEHLSYILVGYIIYEYN